MSFGSEGVTKLDYARYLAACLAVFSHKQRDRIGLVTFDEDIVDFVPASAKHLEVGAPQDRHARVEPAEQLLQHRLFKIAEAIHRRGIVVLISDLYDEPEAILDASQGSSLQGERPHRLSRARSRRAPFSLTTSRPTTATWRRARRCPSFQTILRDEYRKLVARAHRAARPHSRGQPHRLRLLDTSTPLDYALFSYLSTRQRITRVR